MITAEMLADLDHAKIGETEETLDQNDLSVLIEFLNAKDDRIRYSALLLLESRSGRTDEVYRFWNVFLDKLRSQNSYQRSIGLTLIAENAKWDTENQMSGVIDDYLSLLGDEKPITVRQCIRGLFKIIPYNKPLHAAIAQKLMDMDLRSIRETMRKLVLTDILEVLLSLRAYTPDENVGAYIMNSLTGDILDKKTKKSIMAALNTDSK